MLDKRRYDIDALRSIALFLLIIYHLGLSFTSVAPYILFVQNKKVTDEIWPLLNLMNTWRIPLVFLIAGIALRLSFQKRKKLEILKERGKIIGLPWIFGTLFFASSSAFITGKYFKFDINFIEAILLAFEYNGLHLWFLVNLIIYCLLIVPVLNLFSTKNFFSKILNKPGGIFVFAIPIVAEGDYLNSQRFYTETYGDYYNEYANTDHGLLLGFLWFLIGIILTSQEESFWESNKRNWRIHLFFATGSYLYRLFNNFENGYALDNRLLAFESFNFIFLLLGLAAVYLNNDSPQLTYYRTAVYPLYIVHLPVQMSLMYFFSEINIHPIVKFPLVLFLICFLSLTIYHSIKNIKVLRPLFGLRNK